VTVETGAPEQPGPAPAAGTSVRARPPSPDGDGGRSDPTGTRRFGLQLVALPSIWLFVFLVVPVLVLLAWSFRPPGIASFTAGQSWTIEAYVRNITTTVFMTNLVKTVASVFVIALAAVVFSYPIAYVLARVATERRYLLLSLIVAPALVSYMLRLFAWRSLLGSNGVFNHVLMTTGITSEPVGLLLYNRFAVILVLTYVWLPFAALPIFARLEQMGSDLAEAAQDLGASRWSTFRRITLPLSMPGVYAAFFFVFIPTLGDFATAAIVGGSGGRMFGNVIRGVVGTPDYPSGAVLAVLLFAVAATAMVVAFRVLRIEDVTDLG
jgi:spermidine/putrescine transport system permease protein